MKIKLRIPAAQAGNIDTLKGRIAVHLCDCDCETFEKALNGETAKETEQPICPAESVIENHFWEASVNPIRELKKKIFKMAGIEEFVDKKPEDSRYAILYKSLSADDDGAALEKAQGDNKNIYAAIAKALYNQGNPLTKKEIELLAQLVDKASNDIIISVSPFNVKSYLLGYRIRELIKKAGNIKEIRKILDSIKQPPTATTQAEALAAISKMIYKPVAQLQDTLALKHLEQYTFSEITWQMDNMKNKIRHAMVDTIANHESPLHLARKLHKAFDTYEIDMRRVAITETTRARNEGTLAAISQSEPTGEDTLVYFLVSVDACKNCKHIYLNTDGSPKLFRIKDIRGKTNYGKKQSEWEAAIIIHPNCRCGISRWDPEIEEWKKKWRAKYAGKVINIEPEKPLQKAIPNDPVKKAMDIHGVKIAIEWPKGSIRFADKPYKKKMECDYGYIHGTNSEHDDMDLDCYVGPKHDSKKVFELKQLTKDGKFDEMKYLLGYNNQADAKADYIKHMPAEWCGEIKEIKWPQFEHIIATNLKAPEIKKALGDMRPGHKYLKREKDPETGEWKYTYTEDKPKEAKPTEVTPEEIFKPFAAQNIKYEGIMQDKDETDESLVMFTDKITGSTLAVKKKEFTAEKIQAKIDASRKAFKEAKEKKQATENVYPGRHESTEKSIGGREIEYVYKSGTGKIHKEKKKNNKLPEQIEGVTKTGVWHIPPRKADKVHGLRISTITGDQTIGTQGEQQGQRGHEHDKNNKRGKSTS